MVRKSRAFTLIEVVMSVFILMLLLAMAVPSLTGVLADRRLRRTLDNFNNLVHQAQERSVAEHRPYLIVWGKGSVKVRPEFILKDEEPKPVAELPLGRSESLALNLPAALIKDPPAEWIFWQTGTCEPAIVKFAGRDGTWTAKYSALTTTPELIGYVAK